MIRGLRLRLVVAATMMATAGGVLAAPPASWLYLEERNEMDDSLTRRYVAAASEGEERWFASVDCEFPKILWLAPDLGDPKEGSDTQVLVRFDKAPPLRFYCGYEGAWVFIRIIQLVPLMKQHVLLRIQLPEHLSDTVLRFDLLDFNQAWAQCAGSEGGPTS